ncbi:hypothetical protein [Escherichia coli]|uniref:hypothetical protein n=1 Tax=Escherichia coli TaxID=562 RepID=UPI002DB84B13
MRQKAASSLTLQQCRKNSLNRLIRCVCGTKIGPDPRNFNQRVSLGRHDLLIRTFPKGVFGFGQRTLLFFFAGR